MTESQKKAQATPDPVGEHERRNEGGREFGHVHQPTQAEQASKNHGLADDVAGNRPREGERKTA